MHFIDEKKVNRQIHNARTHAHTHARTHARAHTHTNTHTLEDAHHARTHARTHARARARAHTHTHTHTIQTHRHILHIFSPQNALFRHNRSSTQADSGKIVQSQVSCILNFKDIQLRDLNARKVTLAFFNISGQILKETSITLPALRFKLNSLDQTCRSLKSNMQLAHSKNCA